MKKTKYIAQTLAVATVTLLSVSTAKAQEVKYSISDGGLESFNLSYNYGPGTANDDSVSGALAGGIAITKQAGGSMPGGFPASYVTVCTDIGGTVYEGSTYGYDLDSFANQVGIRPEWGLNAYDGTLGGQLPIEQGEAIQNAAQLFYAHYSVLSGSSTTDKAALQLAVWAAVYDTSYGGTVAPIATTLGSGVGGARFAVSSGDSAAISEADSWLSVLNGTYTYTGNLLFPDPNTTQGNGDGEPVQELMMRTTDATPVPEPTTLIAGALFVLPFGASTLRFLRKNRTA